MTRIVIVSDTHVPSRTSGVPEWVTDEIRRVDHTIHASDFDSKRAYGRIEELADGDATVETLTGEAELSTPVRSNLR